MKRTAFLSDDGRFRYLLGRVWAEDELFETASRGSASRILWLMINPSTGDAQADDPTVRKCVHFSRAWGFGGLGIVNLYAYRTPSVEALAAAGYPDGDPTTLRVILEAAKRADEIVFAWGAFDAAAIRARALLVRQAVGRASRIPPKCLGVTNAGAPLHPLMIPNDRTLELWEPAAVRAAERGGIA